ncbi:MAG TPA: C39 family peptidase [Dissulfurispiraceae bacterium]
MWKKLLEINIFFAFLVVAACSPPAVRTDLRAAAVAGVPFYPQEDYQCGPASLAGVMNYWGAGATPEGIAKDIYSGSAKGTLNIDMLLYPQKMGFKAVQYAGGWDDLREKIDAGYPLVVLVDYGFWVYQVNHFMVITGYDGEHVTANSGRTAQLPIDRDNFLKSWKRTNYWTLLIKPK